MKQQAKFRAKIAAAATPRWWVNIMADVKLSRKLSERTEEGEH